MSGFALIPATRFAINGSCLPPSQPLNSLTRSKREKRFPIHYILTLISLLLTVLSARGATNTADVVVYGSTPGGFCAAIAAARDGTSVILVEPTHHIGGMNTGGLSFSDSNQMYRDTLIGLFHEWHLRIQQDYEGRGITLPYDVNVKNQANWSYEPHVAMRITTNMLAEAGVQVFTQRYLQSVDKAGPRITQLHTSSNHTFAARVFVDGSYEGDLMAAAGVSWTIGREGTADFNESLAGKRYPKSTMNIDGFDTTTNALPLVTTTNAGPVTAGDDNIMTYSYRLSLTTSATNKIPMPAPANYNPARFEVMRRYVLQHGANSVNFDRYSVPNNKVDGNNSIGRQFSLGLVGGALGWATADEAGRAAIFEAHKQYTLEFIHFLSTDPVFTQAQRDSIARWGLCADEFPDTGHFPPQLYVRESRRMQGMYVINQNDIIGTPSKPDSIMISSFPIDSHDCQRVALPGGGVINEGTIFPVRQNGLGYPYQVPYRAILPQPAECDNLLVPVALSCTHVAISSLRIEATWMLLGQSAGIAAAMAVDQDVTVQDLPYNDLRTQLRAQDQVLELPLGFLPLTGIILDDPDAELTGAWNTSTTLTPFVGDGYRFTGAAGTPNDGSATAIFRFTTATGGIYQLNMAYTPDPTRATNVTLTVTSGAHNASFTIDQTIPRSSSNRLARAIGTVRLATGVESIITLSTTGATGFVILDAIQLVLDEEIPNETNCFQEGIFPNSGFTHDATYVRSSDVTRNFNDISQLIVGTTEGASADVLRSLLEFDIGSLSASASVGPVSLTLTTFTTPGINNVDSAGGLTAFDLYTYAFDLDETNATWSAPGFGDGTPGGTPGTLLSTASLDVEVTGQSITFADSPAFRSAVSAGLAGDGFLRMLLRNNDETIGTHNFARFSDETVTPTIHRPKLLITLQFEDPVIRIAYTGGEAAITFTSAPSKTYRVEAKQDLDAVTWIELVDRLNSQGLQTTFVDTITSGLDRVYYRITENE
ncbi:MAG: hypothetical protein ACI9QL_005151 [Candidatus Omnitrophota bacterium]